MTRDYDPNFKQENTLFLVGGKVLIQKDDKILLLQRSDKSGRGGEWSFPGGAVENEDAIEGIQREIDEELVIKVRNIHPFTVRTYFEKKPTIIIGYVCDYESGEIDLNWEHDDFKWLSPDEALKLPLTPDAKFLVEEYKKYKL